MAAVTITGGETIGAQQSITISTATSSSNLKTTYKKWPRFIHCNTDGNIIGQLQYDSADRTFTLTAGTEYHYRFKSITSATATGLVLF